MCLSTATPEAPPPTLPNMVVPAALGPSVGGGGGTSRASVIPGADVVSLLVGLPREGDLGEAATGMARAAQEVMSEVSPWAQTSFCPISVVEDEPASKKRVRVTI